MGATPVHRGRQPRYGPRAVLLAIAIAVATPAAGQISPGPLARAHGELEGGTNCFRCHGARGGGTSMNEQCLECHREIGWQVERNLGLHGRERKRDCARCHPDHAGVDFELVAWDEGDPKAFDHDRTGWTLEGRHAALDCRACHKAELQRSEVMKLTKRNDPDRSWLGLERDCLSCHADPHRETLGPECGSCHGLTRWKPATGFDHAETDYSLTGKHVDLKCVACHLVPGKVEMTGPDGSPAPRYRPVPHDECSACHQDTHAGRLGPACASCHVTDGFDRTDRDRFDHARTRYPLRGRHASIECAACHDENRAWGKKPRFDTCGACHADAHAGRATLAGRAADCDACHDERVFSPSTYRVADHAASVYPLEGRHVDTPCRECHRKVQGSTELGRAGIELRPRYATCRDCHEDSHAGQLRDRPDGGACESCHRVDGFRPTTYSVEQHASLSLPLEGRHAETPCASCHGPQRRDLPELPGREVLGKAAVALTVIDASCVSCHLDPHDGRFNAGEDPARGCADCHSFRSFRPSTVGNDAHDDFGYRLDGGHRAVPCFLCHRELEQPPADIRLLRVSGEIRPLPFRSRHERCADCHATPHGDQFDSRADLGACDGCHTVDGFRPASRFDHDRHSSFRLAGAHEDVACARCHTSRAGPDGTPVVVYRATPSRCRDCHTEGSIDSGRNGGSP